MAKDTTRPSPPSMMLLVAQSALCCWRAKFLRRSTHACVARTLWPPCTAVVMSVERMAIPTRSQPQMRGHPHIAENYEIETVRSTFRRALHTNCCHVQFCVEKCWASGHGSLVGRLGFTNTTTMASLTGTSYQINFCVRSSVDQRLSASMSLHD